MSASPISSSYVYTTTDHEFGRDQFVVLLTPLVVMTGIGVPVMFALEWDWLIVPLTANTTGVVANLWITMSLLSYSASVCLEDHENEIRILGDEHDRPPTLSVTALVWDALSKAAIGTIGLPLALAVGRPLVLSVLGVESFTVETPDTVTFLFSFVSTLEEISFAVGPGVLAVGAALELYSTFAQSHRRRRRPADEPTDTVASDR